MIKNMLIYDKYNLIKKLDEKFWRYILMFPPPPDFYIYIIMYKEDILLLF